MQETIAGSLYDYPKYYDLVFGSDWLAEYEFLTACFAKHLKGKAKRLFEPACGTGRLMYRFARAGYEVAGNDLNAKAVAFCNARLKRYGYPASAVVGDMANFTVKKKYDAAFNTINSFRHLATEEQALGHLKCTAAALRKGGLYVLGLHLTPPRGKPEADEESWAAQRGQLCVLSKMWSTGVDRRERREGVGMCFDVYTPTRTFRLANHCDFRTYSNAQMQELITASRAFEIVETYDFAYEIDEPVVIDSKTEDVIYVLRRK